MFKWIGALILIVVASVAAAKPVDGHILLAKCEQAIKIQAVSTAQGLYDEGYCDGLLGGVGNVGLRNHVYCPKGDLDTTIVRSIVYPWLLARPHRLDEDAQTLIIEALAETWPCPDATPDWRPDDDRSPFQN